MRIDNVAQKTLDQSDWEPRDRALFLELLYGTIRWHGRIEWILKQLSDEKETTHLTANAAAVIGIYQMLFLDRIPDFAIVDTAVVLTRRAHGPAVGGWVNAILRRIGRERDRWKAAEPESKDPSYNLSIKYSHPHWMIERWARFIPPDRLETFLAWNNRRPFIILRTNVNKTTVDEIVALLSQNKIKASPSRIDSRFLIIEHSGNPLALEPVKNGLASVQDHSQGLVAKIVNPQSGEKILDLCAAPGGKTGFLAELCPECKITATDKDADRLEMVTDLIQQQGYSNIEIVSYNDVLASRNRYDAILIDAPCTGTGVLARRPDLRWRRISSDVARMSAIQFQLLRYAVDRINVGGRIIYSTCSIEPEENGKLVDQFINNYRQFSEIPVTGLISESLIDHNGRLNLLGPEIEGDGVFTAVLVRYK